MAYLLSFQVPQPELDIVHDEGIWLEWELEDIIIGHGIV
jgi:hypothetical protein